MERDSFIFYRSFFEAISLMPPEVQAEVYPAIVEYALNGNVPKGMSPIAKGVFTLVKPNLDASVTRQDNGKRFGKLGGRPPKKQKASPPAKAKPKAEGLTPSENSTLTLQQEVEQMKADRTWNEPVCIKFHLNPEELARRLDAFHNHCQCENDSKPHESLNDAKRHFCAWMRKAYAHSEQQQPANDEELPPPSYEFNGGFGGQDV
jgi:hypothetical protein